MLTQFLSTLLSGSILNTPSPTLVASNIAMQGGELIAQLRYDQQILQQEGTLEDGDAILPNDGSLYDSYSFEGRAGQAISIILTSEDFDTYLILLGPDKNVVDQNDDFTENDLNSTLLLTLPNSGTYTVLVNSFNKAGHGRYTLSITSMAETNSPDPSVTP